MPRDAVSRTANVERNGGHKWVKNVKMRLHSNLKARVWPVTAKIRLPIGQLNQLTNVQIWMQTHNYGPESAQCWNTNFSAISFPMIETIIQSIRILLYPYFMIETILRVYRECENILRWSVKRQVWFVFISQRLINQTLMTGVLMIRLRFYF